MRDQTSRAAALLGPTGRPAGITLFTEDGKSHCAKHSIERALEAAGFEAITWAPLEAAAGAPEAVATTKDPPCRWACSRRASREPRLPGRYR